MSGAEIDVRLTVGREPLFCDKKTVSAVSHLGVSTVTTTKLCVKRNDEEKVNNFHS